MPIKKKTTAAKKPAVLGPKAKLMKLAVTTLRNKAKKLGISDVSKRTKENLVQSIILGEARQKKGTAAGKKATAKRKASTTRQTGSSSSARDRARKALAPGRRVSRTGRVYYERRKNRSDKPGMLSGYNGWANWETWNANLWDSEAFYDIVQDAKDSGDSKEEVAQILENYYDEAAEMLNAKGFFGDVIKLALGSIDWEEIVENHWEE